MSTANEDKIIILREHTFRLLFELRFGAHRIGYRYLLLLIPHYAVDSSQSLSKDLYPYAAKFFGYTSWQPVERAIRIAIMDAWKRCNPDIWNQYFYTVTKPPSNKQFIATLADQIQNAPPVVGRGKKSDERIH